MNRARRVSGRRQRGLSLLELLIATLIGGLLMVAVDGVIGAALALREEAGAQHRLARAGAFAMQRMLDAAAHSPGLILPLRDKPDTAIAEHIRDGRQPPTRIGSYFGMPLYASGVLALRLPRHLDLDADGIADADNDGDGRFDEDLPADASNDNDNGVRNIDDNDNGFIDAATWMRADDDEDASQSEDPINGIDDDGDNNFDEDPGADMNGDGAPGVRGIDDDGDGAVDEGDAADDDEDGRVDEDWLDPLVFYLRDGRLLEQTPLPWDADGDGDIDGRDTATEVLLEGVTRFRVERVALPGGRDELIDILLEYRVDGVRSHSLSASVRIGGGL